MFRTAIERRSFISAFMCLRAQIWTYIAFFTNILGMRDMENMEISRNMGMGDIEAHTDRPRHFWGIVSRLGHPSKYQNRPRARRNHITASRTMFHAPMYVHMGEIPPSFDGIAQKQNARGRGGERGGSGMGEGRELRGAECVLRDQSQRNST